MAPAGDRRRAKGEASALMIGETIDDRYRLLRLIGEGAMGAVYEAAHVNTGRVVAIKLIQQMALSDTDIYARFEREARVAGAIDSRHVASVLDSGRDKTTGVPYMALEMLRGEDLSSFLERKGRLPANIALRLVTQACTGLAKAHAAEVVHRDIKPANIFLALDEDGERVTVKILDFGIAKFKPSGGHGINLTQTGKMLGTPRYMSPEQAQGEKDIDFRTDVWSLGSVLYEALTGRPPHDEPEHIGKLIFSICSTTPPIPSTLVEGITQETDRTVMKSLERPRDARYDTARELLHDLEALTPDGADLFADELGLVRRSTTEFTGAGETRRISRPSRPSSQRGTRERASVDTRPDGTVVIDRSGDGVPMAEEDSVASTLFATNSTVHPLKAVRPPSRLGLYVGALGVGVAGAFAALFFLRGEPSPATGTVVTDARAVSAPSEAPTAAPVETARPTTSAAAPSASVSSLTPTSSGRVVRTPNTPPVAPSSRPIDVRTTAVPHATSFE